MTCAVTEHVSYSISNFLFVRLFICNSSLRSHRVAARVNAAYTKLIALRASARGRDAITSQ